MKPGFWRVNAKVPALLKPQNAGFKPRQGWPVQITSDIGESPKSNSEKASDTDRQHGVARLSLSQCGDRNR